MATPGQFVEQAMLSGWQQGENQKYLDDYNAKQQKITDLLNLRTEQLKTLGMLRDENGNPAPGYDSAMADYQKTLGDIRDFYHPDKNPGAIANFGHMLTDSMHLTNPQHRAAAESARQTARALEAEQQAQADARALPQNPYMIEHQNEQMASSKQLAAIQGAIKNFHAAWPNATPEETQAFMDSLKEQAFGFKPASRGNWEMVTHVVNGKPVSYQRNKANGTWVQANGDDIQDKDAFDEFLQSPVYVKPGKMTASDRLLDAYAASLHTTIENLDENQRAQYPYWLNSLKARFGSHQAVVYDRDGNAFTVDLTNTSNPVIVMPTAAATPSATPATPQATPTATPKPGTAPAATPPKTATGNKGGLHPLPLQKATPSYTKAKNDYDDALKLAAVAQQVKNAPDDAVNQKRLAVALERMSAGRFTTQALDYVLRAGWGNTIEQWANNPTTGALPEDIVRQLIDGANQNLKAAEDVLKTFDKPTGTPPSSGNSDWDSLPDYVPPTKK